MQRQKWLSIQHQPKDKDVIAGVLKTNSFTTWKTRKSANNVRIYIKGPIDKITNVGYALMNLRNSQPWTNIELFDEKGRI